MCVYIGAFVYAFLSTTIYQLTKISSWCWWTQSLEISPPQLPPLLLTERQWKAGAAAPVGRGYTEGSLLVRDSDTNLLDFFRIVLFSDIVGEFRNTGGLVSDDMVIQNGTLKSKYLFCLKFRFHGLILFIFCGILRFFNSIRNILTIYPQVPPLTMVLQYRILQYVLNTIRRPGSLHNPFITKKKENKNVVIHITSNLVPSPALQVGLISLDSGRVA